MSKTVIITGANRGIGKGIAYVFASKGYNIFLAHCGEAEKAYETAKEIKEKYGKECVTFDGNLAEEDVIKELVKKAVEAYGHIDVLVNNAGITKDMLLMRMTEEQFDDVINTNLKGTFNMIRHVSNVMLKQRSGAIINMASVVGINGNIGQANYAASKAGIIGLTKSTAKELASRGITCNAIAPGYVETDMTAVLKEDVQNAILSAIPLKRGGKVEDIARAVVFLAENDYITGQVLNVDGGMVM